MAKVLQTAQAFVATATGIGQGTETQIALTPPSPTPFEVNHVRLHVAYVFESGSTGVTLTLKFYRGNSTSAPLAHATPAVAPGYLANFPVQQSYDFAEDVVGADNVQYLVTMTTANVGGTFSEVMAAVTVS